jgi:putative phosphoesterase
LRAADLILHAGDLVSVSFLEELAALGPPVEAVFGNMDEPALKESLPEERIVDVERARIAMVHIAGPVAGREERLLRRFPDCAAVVYGHTHVPHVERHEGVWILNPGSPTERRRAPTRAMLELQVARGTVLPKLVAL